MLNRCNFSNLSFSSKIKFVSDGDFEEITAHVNRSAENNSYIGDPWNRTIMANTALTDGIAGCVSGGLTNPLSRDVVMFHYKPANEKQFEKVEGDVSSGLSRIGQFTDKLKGLIIGGKAQSSGDMQSYESMRLAAHFEGIFNNLGAAFSKFTGQRTPGGNTNLYYSGNEDTWYVNYTNGNSYGDRKQIKTVDDIKKNYYDIRLSDEDQVYIDDARVSKAELEAVNLKRIEGGYEFDAARSPYSGADSGYTFGIQHNNNPRLYLANYGQDRGAIWIEGGNNSGIAQVMGKIGEICRVDMFKDVKVVKYAGDYCMPGFRKTGETANGKDIYFINVDAAKKTYRETVLGSF